KREGSGLRRGLRAGGGRGSRCARCEVRSAGAQFRSRSRCGRVLIQITEVRSIAARLALQDLKQEVIFEAPLLQMGNVALGRVIARETIETLTLVAMSVNPRIMQFGLKLEF